MKIRNLALFIIVVILFQLLFNIKNSFSQELSDGEYDLEQRSLSLFKQKKYEEALPGFSQLLSVYPKDPFYNYYYGVSLIQTNSKTLKAIEYLKYAAPKDVKKSVYFFIGKAYHLNYQFDEAIKYYNLFLDRAPKKESNLYPASRYIEMCQNGTELVQYVSDLIVIENKQIKDQNFFHSYNIDEFGGKIILKPIDFKTKVDIKKKDKSVIFLPSDNEKVYVSSYGNNKKASKDIYVINKNELGEWGIPENIGNTINTQFDEDFPYLHADGITLYFCSKGHNSMGGYDVFKSVFDTINNKWTKPINLDFPINSPFDDILYVTDTLEDYAYFASKRETGTKEISVYKIKVNKNPIEKPIKNLEELIKQSKLSVTDPKDYPDTEIEKDDTQVDIMALAYDKNQEKWKSSLKASSYKFKEFELNDNPTSEDVKSILKNDTDVISSDISNLKKNVDITYVISDEKNNEANNKRVELKELIDQIDLVSDENQKGDLIKKATHLEEEIKNLEKEAITAFNLANNLNNTVKEKEKDLASLTTFAENISVSSKSTEEIYSDINNKRKELNKSQEKYPTIENELIKRELLVENKQKSINKLLSNILEFDNTLKQIQSDIQSISEDIEDVEDIEEKKNFEAILNDLKTDYSENEKLKIKATKTIQKSKIEKEVLDKEVAIYKNLIEKTNQNENAKQEYANKSKAINKENLEDELSEKELIADQSFSASIKDNISKPIDTEDLTDDTHIESDNVEDNNFDINKTENIEADNSDIAESDNIEVENSDIALNDITDNSSNDVVNTSINDKTALNTTNKISKEYRSITAKNILSQASKNKEISASLYVLADNKRKTLATIDDPKQKRIVEKEINELEELALIKEQQAYKNFTQARKAENQFLADNNIIPNNELTESEKLVNNLIAEMDEYIEENPPYPFESVKDENTEISQYKRELFNTNYYNNLSAELKSRIKTLEESEVGVANEDAKIDLAQKIDAQKKLLSYAEKKSQESSKKANKLKEVAFSELDNVEFTAEELLLNATNFKTTQDVDFTEDENILINKTKDNRIIADGNFNAWEIKTSEISSLESEIEVTEKKSAKKSLEKKLETLFTDANEEFEKFNSLYKDANNEVFNIYSKKIKNNKVFADIKDVRIADLLTKEAELYFNKAQNIRENASLIQDYTERSNELIKAKDLELISIQKQAHALDLYLTAKSDINEDPNIIIATETNTTVDSTLTTENKVKKKPEITLTVEEEKQLKEFKKLKHKSEVMLSEANKEIATIEKLKEEAANLYSQSAKKKLLKGIDKDELDAKTSVLEASIINSKSDSLKYFLYKNQINELTTEGYDITKKNKIIASQYVKDADFYYSEGEKLENDIEKADNLESKLELIKKSTSLKEKALINQETAVDMLMNTNPIDFVSTNNIKIDRFDVLNKEVDTEKIIKIKTDRIVNSLNLSEEDLEAIDESNKIRLEALSIISGIDSIEAEIDILNEIIKTTESNKDKKRALKEIDKNKNVILSNKLASSDMLELVNDTKYYIYKDQIKSKRIKGNSEEARQGRQLEKEANRLFRRAKSLRGISFDTEDKDHAYELLEEAQEKEVLSVEALEKAYGIYLGLKPIEEEIEDYRAKLLVEDKSNNNLDIISTKADITPIETIVDSVDNKSDIVAYNEDNEDAENNIDIDNTNNADSTDVDDTNIDSTETETTALTDNNLFVDKNSDYNETDLVNDNTEEDIVANDITEDNTEISLKTDSEENSDITDDNTTENNTEANANVDNAEITENNEKSTDTNDENTEAFDENTTISKTDDALLVSVSSKSAFKFSLTKTSVYSDSNPISVNVKLPDGIIFKVQIGAFKKPIPQDIFKGLNPVVGETLPNSQYTRYLIGQFRTNEAARLVLNEVKGIGYRDAFIVAYKDGKRIQLYQALNELRGASSEEKKVYETLALNEVKQIKNRPELDDAQTTNLVAENRNEAVENIVEAEDVKNVTGLMYTVQIGVYKKTISKDKLYNLSPIYQDKTTSGFVRYTKGVYNDYNKALSEKNRIVTIGIKDAFVTAYNNGKKISVSEARKLENDNTVLADQNTGHDTKSVEADINTDANKLSFKVQIGAYKENVPTNIVSSFIKLSSSRGLDQKVNEQGITIYSVGKFDAYAEAARLREILMNEGLTDAFVVAYKGEKKISITDALKMINQ